MFSRQRRQEKTYGNSKKVMPFLGASLALGIFALSSAVLLVAGPQLTGGVDVGTFSETSSNLTATLGITGGAAVAVWDAVNSWWAAALSVLLVPMGFGAWAGVVKMTAQMLIRQLGKNAARQAFLRF